MKQKLNIYCFDVYWSSFHFFTNQHKLNNKTECERVWDSCNCSGTKRNIIDSVDRGIKLSALEYLKLKLG